jgi:hypothetical protein
MEDMGILGKAKNLGCRPTFPKKSRLGNHIRPRLRIGPHFSLAKILF